MSQSASGFNYGQYYQLGWWDRAKAFGALVLLRIMNVAARHKLSFVPRLLRPFKLSQTLRRGSSSMRVNIPLDHVELSIYNEIFLRNGYRMPFPLDGVESVLDIGANVGFATLYFHLHCPDASRVVMVEGNPQLIGRIKNNLSVADLDAEVMTGVVSAWPQPTVDFGIARRHNSSRLLISETPRVRALEFEKIVPIPNYNLTALLRTLDLKTVSLLKMDIESAEIELLEKDAGSLEAVKFICIELHGGPQVNQRMKNILTDHGFEVFAEPARHPVVEQVFARNRRFVEARGT